ncbi:MAG TPA: methyltransferase domain-containing protein [bacterium]|nr:methyltransferase domain-containing protein [bacterium]
MERLKSILICPACGCEKLHFDFFNPNGEGMISCPACRTVYPVIRGIPRMLTGKLREELFKNDPDFFNKYAEVFPAGSFSAREEKLYLRRKTMENFGRQWLFFPEFFAEFSRHFLSFINPPVEPGYFRGKLGLDSGCGFGRHLFYAGLWGSEMVGMDISFAIDAAGANLKKYPSIHLVQADIHRPPFKKGTFDFVYSLGVLHHLPDPVRGIDALLPLVRSNGDFFIWVYSKKEPLVNFLVELSRKAIKPLSLNALYGLCYLAALAEWHLILRPLKYFKKNRFLSVLTRWVPNHFHLYTQYPFRVSYADWVDRLSAPIRHYFSGEELKTIYMERGLQNIIVTPTQGYGWRAFGTVVKRETLNVNR